MDNCGDISKNCRRRREDKEAGKGPNFFVGSSKRKHDGASSSKQQPQKKFFKKNSANSSKGKEKVDDQTKDNKCNFCKHEGHYQKDCPEFLKWLLKRGTDEITFVDELLYVDFSTTSWWIDSGATSHVANSMQDLSIIQTMARGARRLRVANGVEVDVEAIGSLTLELHTGFRLPVSFE